MLLHPTDKVVRFRPSLAAESFGPPITQAVISKVFKIKARTESLSLVRAGKVEIGSVHAGGRGLVSSPSFDSMTARSITF